MKRAIIVGATSGIGQEIAKVLLAQGWKIGIAGRRKELLTAFQERNPEQIATQALDVTQKDAVLKLNGLIEQLGGMDLFFIVFRYRQTKPGLATGNRNRYGTH